MIFIDQMNRSIFLDQPPKRIISLVPSQTELLIDLGLTNNIVGITKFCIHPKNITDKITKVGGTKNFSLERIKMLQPDLIIANKEENDEVNLTKLSKEYPVWISDVKNLNDCTEMIKQLGAITLKTSESNNIVKKINEKFNSLTSLSKNTKAVIYLIWNNPYMSINKDTFINDMIEKCGYKNLCSHLSDRYPIISIEKIKELNPELIFLSSEPFPFKEKHQKELKNIFPNTKIYIVDGEMFSWYGSRILKSVDYFTKHIIED